MWTIEAIRKTKVTKEQIWRVWADVPNWNDWDKDVETSEIFGKFSIGTKGVLKPKGGPKTKFEMIECTPFKSFTDRSLLPMCKIDFIHSMTENENDLEITHKVVMTGIMTPFFSRVIGEKIKKGLPRAVDKLIELAEKTK